MRQKKNLHLKDLTVEDVMNYPDIFNAGLTLYDPQNRCLIDSIGYAEKMTGYTFEELSSPGFYDKIVYPNDRADFNRIHHEFKLLKNGEIIRFNMRLLTKKNNEYDWLHMKAMVFERDPVSNKPVTLIISGINITDKVIFAESLNEKNTQLATISHINEYEVKKPVSSILNLFKLLSPTSFQNKADLEIFTHLEKTVEELDRIIGKVSDESQSE